VNEKYSENQNLKCKSEIKILQHVKHKGGRSYRRNETYNYATNKSTPSISPEVIQMMENQNLKCKSEIKMYNL
jgi:hypothetical protein